LNIASPSSSLVLSSSSSQSTSITPSLSVTSAITPSSSPTPLYTIIPFSPSNTPTSAASPLPVRSINDFETVNVEITCDTSFAVCCSNFQLLFGTSVSENYPNLMDILNCTEATKYVHVQFVQYGSSSVSSFDILSAYWSSAGCSSLDPVTGGICKVSTTSLDNSLWTVESMFVDYQTVDPSPLPAFYYYEEPTSDATSLFSSFSYVLLFFIIMYLC